MRLSLFALCLLLCVGAFALPTTEPQRNIEISMATYTPLPRRADVFRKEFALKLCKGRAERKDYDDCRKGIETLERPPFCLHLAEYYRIIDRNSA